MPETRILIIDDDPDIVAAMTMILETKGYQVSSAKNKQEGIDQVEGHPPDLMILDVMMEKMSDGFELARKFKSDPKYKTIPILMLTCVGEKTGFRHSRETADHLWLPVDEYCAKPLSSEHLLEKVARLLSQRK